MKGTKKTTEKATPEAQAPRDLVTITATGDRLQALIALRDYLAENLQRTASTRDIAAISRRLMQCMEEIENLEKKKHQEENSTLNMLKFQALGKKPSPNRKKA